MRHLYSLLAYVLVTGLCCVAASPARADGNSEMVVKAVMIRKFVEFIKWPEAVAPQKEMRVKVCVYGDSPMSQMGAVFAKSAGSSPVKYTLNTITQLDDVASACHVLFIGESQMMSLPSLRKKPVLTVSDADSFVDKGGMIGFQLIDSKVRYNINNKAFGESQLKIDAQLLEIANKVVE